MVCSVSIVILLLVVIFFAPDVVVVQGGLLIRLFKKQGLLVEAVFEDGFNVLIGEGFDGQCPCGGLLESLRGVVVCQPHNA